MKRFHLLQLPPPRRTRPTYPASGYGLRSDGALVTYTRYINRRHNTNYIPPKPKP